MTSSSTLLLFSKPFRVLTQFTSTDGKANLSNCSPSAHAHASAGRLDYDSEGLVLLTDSGALQTRLADPRWKVSQVYFVQVEGEVQDDALARLRRGVVLNDGPTLPAEVEQVSEPDWLAARSAGSLSQTDRDELAETDDPRGRNRQVRHDCGDRPADAAVDPLGGGPVDAGKSRGRRIAPRAVAEGRTFPDYATNVRRQTVNR